MAPTEDLTALSNVALLEALTSAKHAVLDAYESDPVLGEKRADWLAADLNVTALHREHTRRRLVAVGCPAELLPTH